MKSERMINKFSNERHCSCMHDGAAVQDVVGINSVSVKVAINSLNWYTFII